MTTYTEAEAARANAVRALLAAGLTEEANRLAALPPITDRKSAEAVSVIARNATAAADAAQDRAARAAYATIGASRAAGAASYQCRATKGEPMTPEQRAEIERRTRDALILIRDADVYATTPWCKWCGVHRPGHDTQCPVVIASAGLGAGR